MDDNNVQTIKYIIVINLLAGIMSLPLLGYAQKINQPNPFFRDSTRINQKSAQNESIQSRGKWALMFQIDQNFTLKDFSGALISFQKSLSDKNALRLGLNLNGGYTDQVNSPTQTTRTGKFNIGISLNYLWYLHSNRKIRFYYGLGPDIAFGYNHSKNSQNSGVNITKQINASEKAGLNGVAGVEWFVNPKISLVAEYVPELTGTFTSNITKTSNSTSNFNTHSKTTSKEIHLGATPVRFGVSVYF